MTAKRFAAVFATGMAAAQAGHLAAYELRFGGAAQQVQATGVHAYFPAVARTGLGLAATGALAAMVLIAAARIASGRHLRPGSGPSFWRLLSVLYTIQLACFGVQETAEALLGGAHASSAPLLLLWGAAGQLPVSMLAAFALRWLLSRLEPALDALRPRMVLTYELLVAALEARTPTRTVAPPLSIPVSKTVYRRGPPSF